MNSALPSIVMNRFGSWRASINQSVLAFYTITRLHRASVIITQIFSTNKNSAECLNNSMNIHYNLQCRFEYFWSSQLSSGRNFHLPIRFHDVNMTSLLLLREWIADHKQIGMIAAYKSREGGYCLKRPASRLSVICLMEIALNSLKPSDAYMRQWTNHHWFR